MATISHHVRTFCKASEGEPVVQIPNSDLQLAVDAPNGCPPPHDSQLQKGHVLTMKVS